MFIEERHKLILECLEKNGSITTNDIMEQYSVSYDTAKRDLRILDEKGLLKRTHGGALSLHQVTVCYFMAQNLPVNKKIRVVTNSIIIADELRTKDNIFVIMLGGEMDHKGNCYDNIAIETIKRLRFDKSFISSAFISAEFGLSIQKTSAISFYDAIIASSKKVIGLYPKEKIGFDSVVSICPAEKLDIMITDWDTAEKDLISFDEKGIEIIIVEKSDEDEM